MKIFIIIVILLITSLNISNSKTISYQLTVQDNGQSLAYLIDKTFISKEIEKAIEDNGFQLISDVDTKANIYLFIGITLTDWNGNEPYILSYSIFTIITDLNGGISTIPNTPNIIGKHNKDFSDVEKFLITDLKNKIYDLKTIK